MTTSDIDRLRAAHPLWAFGSAWTTAASGPDCRRLVARREGIRVNAWTEAELSAKITAEDVAHGWWPPRYRWRITGRDRSSGRPIDVGWLDGAGLVVTQPSEWLVEALAALDGQEVNLAPVGPGFTARAQDPRWTYWTVLALADTPSIQVEGAEPEPPPDDTPAGAVN